MYSAADLPKEGFPHSDIRGSTIARISPRLFAACHVLHRLLAPRHPPNALVSLTIQSPQRPHAVPNRAQTSRCRTASSTLTNLHFHSQIHLSKINLGENSSQPRGSLGSGPAGDQRSRPRPARCPAARRRPAGHRERRAEPDDPAGSLVQVGRNQGTSAPSVTHYP
jgi:hypothetical protein